jgi:hypothetical protein
MKLYFAGLAAAAAAIGFAATSASAINQPLILPPTATVVEKAKCVGFRYNYRSFSSCMKANRFNSKHCNKICS